MSKKIIVIGGGGHAKVLISLLKKLKNFDIVGFTDIHEKKDILDVPYIGNDDVLPNFYSEGIKLLALGIGQIKSSSIRRKVVQSCEKIGFEFPPIISPNSIINENVEIGKGTVVMDGVVINCSCRIGEFSIINTNSSIDHDCHIGDFSHIAPGVTLSGEVNIGNDILIGTGSNVIQGLSICDNSLISAGSSVQKSVSISGVYRGVPAKLSKRF